MRAKFISIQKNICSLEFMNSFGDVVEVNFHAPKYGGYVKDNHNRQVCSKLYLRGATLKWSAEYPLIDLIRREYRKRKVKNG